MTCPPAGPRAGGPARPQVPPNCDLTLGLERVERSAEGRAVWRMTAHERFANPAGVVQGGFLAALCDSAMGAAAVSRAAGRAVWVSNAEMKISFLRPVPVGSRLRCDAVVVSGGSRVAFVEATVVLEDGDADGDPSGGTDADAGGGADGDATRVAARATSTFLYRDRR